MIVSKYISEEIDSSTLPNAPEPTSNVIRRFISDDINLSLCKNPNTIGLSPMTNIPFAMVAYNSDGEYIFAVSIEKTDLRIMSSLIGISVKNLQEEEGVAGFFTEPHIVLYGDGKREDLGPCNIQYLEKNKSIDNIPIDDAVSVLMEYAIDSLDLITEPKEV